MSLPDYPLQPRSARIGLKLAYGTLSIAALALLIVLVTGYRSCSTDEHAARGTLESAGYHNIAITGHNWLSCADDDDTCTGFTATGPSGEQVKGAVGCGYFGCSKGCTIRIAP